MASNEHKNLSNANLHDPKDFSTASNSTFLSKNSSGDLSWVRNKQSIIVDVSKNETTDLTTGDGKSYFRMPYAFTLTSIRASVNTAPAGETLLTIDVEMGESILSTLITIDSGEETSTTAATPPVINISALTDDAEIKINIDSVGNDVAGKGLKVVLIGYPV